MFLVYCDTWLLCEVYLPNKENVIHDKPMHVTNKYELNNGPKQSTAIMYVIPLHPWPS